MDNLYTKNKWDSQFFGFDVVTITKEHLSKVSLKELLQKLKADNVSLVYLFLKPEDEENPEAVSLDGLLVDKKITYVLATDQISIAKTAPQIESYLNKPLTKELTQLALESGIYSRFKRDSHFTHQQFEGLFTEWIEKSLSGTIAKEVYVYKENGKELGLITIGEKNGRCDVGLLSVDENHRGKSIGRKLMETAFAYAKEMNYKEIQVVTQQENMAACKFYEKMGFTPESIVNIYHIWLNRTV